jgi:hypothetical protein
MDEELERLSLLKKLKELGYHSSGRKVRADRNSAHEYPPDRGPRAKNSKERSDKGKTHNMSKARDDIGKSHVMTKSIRADANQTHNYENKSSEFYYSQFQKALQATAIRNHLGEIVGEGATRDRNNIFDLKITHKWKTVTKADGTTYKSKTKITKPLEQYRWEWLRALAQEGDPSKLCTHYHIDRNEWEMWTFSEWANAYLEVSEGGDELHQIIPYFDMYGQPIRYNNAYDKINVEGE